MNLKTLAVAGLAAATFALSASAADARTRVRLGIQLGDGCPPGYFDCYESDGVYYGYVGEDDGDDYRPRRRPRYDDDDDFGGVSCGEARRMLRRQGWRAVRAEDCSGRRYRFIGRRRGGVFSIRVSANSGRIVSVRPLD